MTVDATLASIDGAILDWERGPDAARWHADGGPDRLGPTPEEVTRALVQMGAAVSESLAPLVAGLQRFATSLARDLLPAVARVLKPLNEFAHTAHATQHPREHIRCYRCNPAGNPRPLAIDGAAYRRRQQNRRHRGR